MTELELRAAELVAQMSLEEKVGQVLVPLALLVEPEHLTGAGIGGASGAASAAEAGPRDAAAHVNDLQRQLLTHTRLRIPGLFNEEALCGLRIPDATIFPDGLGHAATWNPQLIERMGELIGRQMRAVGIRQALTPLCDVAPDPRWGRIEESYGEDPYLVGTIAAAFVRGIQGAGNIATLKHFVAYGASEGGRNCQHVHVGPRELREIYGLPFEMAIRLGGARAVMASFNEVDRVPVTGSADLLTGLLREEYAFDGIVISDLSAVPQLVTRHAVVPDLAAAYARAFEAGVDVDLCPRPDAEPLLGAVRTGLLAESTLDRAVQRVLVEKLRLGLFDEPYVDAVETPETFDDDDSRRLARQLAQESVVLLRNDPVDGRPLLPLDLTRHRRIALIGPNADRPYGLLGNYSFPVLESNIRRLDFSAMQGGVFATTAAVPDPANVGAPTRVLTDELRPLVESVPVITPLAGLRAAVGSETEITYARGCGVQALDDSGLVEAVAVARSADVAVVCVGDQSGLITGATVGEGVDGASIGLPGIQRRLVEAVAATGTPTVVVLAHGRPFELGWMTVPAILTAFFPGEEGGTAIADVLLGAVNPGGKLPVSFPAHAGTLPAPYNRTTALGSNYFDADDRALFPFGHGLSYAEFTYADLSVRMPNPTTADDIDVEVTVANTGRIAGAEVVQLYARDRVASSTRPRRELKAFAKIHLEPGGAARVSFTLSADRFSLYDPARGWVVEPGEVDLLVGSSSEDIRCRTLVTFTGPLRVCDRARALDARVTVRSCDATDAV